MHTAMCALVAAAMQPVLLSYVLDLWGSGSTVPFRSAACCYADTPQAVHASNTLGGALHFAIRDPHHCCQAGSQLAAKARKHAEEYTYMVDAAAETDASVHAAPAS